MRPQRKITICVYFIFYFYLTYHHRIFDGIERSSNIWQLPIGLVIGYSTTKTTNGSVNTLKLLLNITPIYRISDASPLDLSRQSDNTSVTQYIYVIDYPTLNINFFLSDKTTYLSNIWHVTISGKASKRQHFCCNIYLFSQLPNA